MSVDEQTVDKMISSRFTFSKRKMTTK
jgi:hypothetical protein